METHLNALINASMFATLGVLIFVVAFVVIDLITPYALWKEIVEEKNLALAVMVAGMSVGIGMIIAAAVH